jgi:hypothetical protein
LQKKINVVKMNDRLVTKTRQDPTSGYGEVHVKSETVYDEAAAVALLNESCTDPRTVLRVDGKTDPRTLIEEWKRLHKEKQKDSSGEVQGG